MYNIVVITLAETNLRNPKVLSRFEESKALIYPCKRNSLGVFKEVLIA